jgi:hypothetical protein
VSSKVKFLIAAIRFIAFGTVVGLIFIMLNGVMVLDHTGELKGDFLYWNDAIYVPCSGVYTEGKTIAETSDGWRINEIEEDETHTFVVIRSFLDQRLLVKEAYDIPNCGAITVAVWNGQRIDDAAFCEAITEIIENRVTNFQCEAENLWELTEGRQMRILYVGFDDCPIGSLYVGYLGTINGAWYITTEPPGDLSYFEGSTEAQLFSCYSIPEAYASTLEKYFS